MFFVYISDLLSELNDFLEQILVYIKPNCFLIHFFFKLLILFILKIL